MYARTPSLILLLAMAGVTADVMAAGNVDGMIKYRQNVMKALGGHVGAADRILRGQVPMTDQLKLHADAAAGIAATIPSLFPADTIPPEHEFSGATVETKATEAVAAKPAEFEKAAKQSLQAANAFKQAVDSGADAATLAKAFADVGKSCKGCHTDFRSK